MEMELVELSRFVRHHEDHSRWIRYYDALVDAGMDHEEALRLVEGAQKDEGRYLS